MLDKIKEDLKKAITEFTIEDFNIYTMNELYMQIANKTNEVIEIAKLLQDYLDEQIFNDVENIEIKQQTLENVFNQLIINAGNSNAEIVDARVDADGTTYSKLGDRLNKVDSQIKDNKNELNILTTDKVNVLSFGAKGDGVNDDTEAIQNAINYVHNVYNLRYVFLPTGKYIITKPLVVPVGVSLVGVEGLKGEYNSTIIKVGNSKEINKLYSDIDKTNNISFKKDSVLLFIDDFPEGYEIGKLNNGAGKCVIKNLYIKSENNSDYGIYSANLNNIEFNNIKVSHVKTAFKSYLLWLASFKNIMCHHINNGFDFDYGIDGWNTTVNMYKCYVHTCSDIGYKFKKIASVHMDTCIYEESFGGFIYAEDRTRITMNNVHTEQCGYKGNTNGKAFKDSSFISLSDSSLTINGGFLQFDNKPNITNNPYNSCFSLVNRSNVVMNNTAIYMNHLSENSLFIYCADRSRFYLNSFTPIHLDESVKGGGQYCDDTSHIYINYNRPSDTWLLKRLGYPCLDNTDISSNFKIYVDSVNGNDFNPGTLERPKRTIKQALKMLEKANSNDVQEIFLKGDFSNENIKIDSCTCRISIRGFEDSYVNVGKLEVNNSYNLHFKYLSFKSANSVVNLNYSHTRFEFVKVNGLGDGLTSNQIGINIQGGQCTVENYIEFNNVYRRIQATRGGYISTLCDGVNNGNAASRMATYSGLIMTNVTPSIKEENNGGKIYS